MQSLVIIPTLNSEEFLEDCLLSVGQSDAILIADMGSSDRTLLIAKNIAAISLKICLLGHNK